MKQFRFILLCATIAVMSAGVTSCKKGVYDEQAALAAQKDLLQFKYDQEIKLEQLRQAGQVNYLNTMYSLQYNFAVRTSMFNDSLSKANQDYWNNIAYRKRDINVQVLDVITGEPILGAEVTIPTINGSVIKVKTDSSGRAFFSPNVNIPNPASAIATKDGYAAGSKFATIGGSYSAGATETIYLWNQASATNTLKGKVYIENDLTNDAVETASKALINVFSTVNVKGYSQRFDWTAVTDDAGNYSIKVPNLSTDLHIAHTAIEGTSKMYVNSFVPGADSIPVVKSIAATYYLGDGGIENRKSVGFSPSNSAYIEYPDLTLAGFVIPNSVARYHVSAPADSNGRAHFVKGLSFASSTLATSATQDSAYLSASQTFTTASRTSAVNYSSNTLNPTNAYTSKYLAGTTVKDTITATLYDVLANADGYWKTAPVLTFERTIDSTTGNKFKYISKLMQKTGGKTIKPDNNFTHQTTLFNLIKTYSFTNAYDYENRNVNSGVVTVSKENINGKTYTLDLTFGAGKLKTAVR